tara:strand:+ start:231 stop:560 length:330 start_codon:yes stop_codon:yes gene_type:complete
MSKKIIENNCPMRATLKIIGGKWRPLILQQVNGQIRRFGELQRLMPEITKQMLTKNLRELEEDEIINRKVYAVVPPKVEYSLTEKGKSLIPILEIMATWGEKQVNENKY